MYSSIQVWPKTDAPEWLLQLVEARACFDWVALVPRDLNDPEIVGLLLRRAQELRTDMVSLADGSALLIGRFGGRQNALRSGIERQPMATARTKAASFGI